MRIVRMKLGDEAITLTEYLVPKGRPVPTDSRSIDHWFQHIAIIMNDMDRAYRRLREHKVEHASTGPQRLPDWNSKAGGIQAFYFKDPDGHPLEILQFPPDKGAAKWHRPSDWLFLGIDHTAIVVADTDASLAFYRDQLGMKVVGESENFGDEQEHLNNVFGARLRITALRAEVGPGIELLEYLSPRTGRKFPGVVSPNDLVATHVRIAVRRASDLESGLNAANRSWISPGAVTLSKNELDADAGLTFFDPDGHILHIVAKTH
jgi:catechol 2,3-dioxygenase-like lactoylglutathione lyase family enzyme